MTGSAVEGQTYMLLVQLGSLVLGFTILADGGIWRSTYVSRSAMNRFEAKLTAALRDIVQRRSTTETSQSLLHKAHESSSGRSRNRDSSCVVSRD